MAKYSILLASFLLISYTIILRFLPFERTVPMHVQQSKFLITENYLYNSDKKTNAVIVGSSMSAMLNAKYLPQNVENLAISGDMAQTGINLIKISGRLPEKLFVELNVISRKEDSTLLNAFTKSFHGKMKGFFPFLQERNQFMTVQLNGVKYLNAIIRNSSEGSPTYPANAQILENVQSGYKNSLNDTTEFSNIRENIAFLKATFQDFNKKGVKIYLYRMPFEKNTQTILKDSKRLIFERKLIQDELATLPNVAMIPEDTTYDYRTTDGIHLIKDDAKFFAKYLLSDKR